MVVAPLARIEPVSYTHLDVYKRQVKVRSIELNVSQRCSGMLASRTDIEESAMAGKMCIRDRD